MPELPEDPLTQLQEGAVQVHELHLTYVSAGFTEDQAFELTKMVLGTILAPIALGGLS